MCFLIVSSRDELNGAIQLFFGSLRPEFSLVHTVDFRIANNLLLLALVLLGSAVFPFFFQLLLHLLAFWAVETVIVTIQDLPSEESSRQCLSASTVLS